MRNCVIEFADIEDERGAGDGAYSLHDLTGEPEEIGKQIAAALADCDLGAVGEPGAVERGESVVLTIKIRVRKV